MPTVTYKRTPEIIAKWRISHAWYRPSKETKERMSIAKKGKIPHLWTLYSREKLSKSLKGKNPWIKGRKHTEEAKKRMSISKKGKRSNAWKGGLEFRKKEDKRNDSAYHEWVELIKKRDKICKLKNENCKGYLIVHHILPWRDYVELRYNINNGITLCQFHHPRKWADEERLMPVFKTLVESNVLI